MENKEKKYLIGMMHYIKPNAEMAKEINRDLSCVYFTSDMYAEQCAVSIVSLFESNRCFDSISVYILEDNVSQRNKERISSIARAYERKVIFLEMPRPEVFWNDVKFVIENVGHTFGRMILGQVLPVDVKQVLCLDSDLLFEDSIFDMWNTNMDGVYIAGVLNGVGDKNLSKLLNAQADMTYFNGGVYLINLELVRRDGIETRYYDYMKAVFDSGKTLGAYEEEVMNKVCYPKVRILHPRYNLMSINLVMNYSEFLKFRGTSYYYSESLIEDAKRNPAIVHIANMFYLPSRSWEKGSDAPYADEYQRLRKLTPWKNDALVEAPQGLKNRIMKRIWHIMPKKMAFFLAAFVRNEIRPLMKKKRDDE